MEWVLVICTQAWLMCGMERRVVYPNEAACYRALDDLYKRNPPDSFKWVICEPKRLNAKPDATQEKGNG